MAAGESGQPRVSVCIPTFNAAHLLPHSLGSAMRQTCAHLEILVYDNASTDDTAGAVRRITGGDPRVRYLRHDSNVGMLRNFSACIEAAAGEYVKFLCADDVLEPDCVERMVAVMGADSRVALVACARRLVDDELRPLGVGRYSRRFTRMEGSAAIRRCFYSGNVIGEPTAILFRRADAARGFRADYPQLLDLEMWFHLLQKGDFAFLPEPLCRVRRHAKQATVQHLASGIVLDDKRRLFREFAASAGRDAALHEKLLWDARMAVTVGRTIRAGCAVSPREVREVYYPGLFPGLVFPLACALWRLAGRDA